MAKADGVIVIDTEIKTDGLSSDVGKIRNTTQGVADVFKKFGATAKQAFDKLKNSSKQTNEAVDAQKNRITLLTSQYEQAKSKVAELTKKFNESAKASGATSAETKQLYEELKKAEDEAEDAEQELDRYSATVKKAGDKSEKSASKISKVAGCLGNVTKVAAKAVTAAIGAAVTGIAAITKQAVTSFTEFEQLSGGVEKIFDEMDTSNILADADKAYQDLGLSANQYLAIINDVGATFAATMGDEAGYNTARQGLKAISDFASGTGANIEELSEKYKLITRSTTQYQSIVDQFSGLLPQTSKEFLKQAQAAGLLSKKYKQLTDVPVAEYQAAVSAMLEKGVADLGLAGNTAAEAATTISGSLAAVKAMWSNLLTAISQGDSWDIGVFVSNFAQTLVNAFNNLAPVIQGALVGIGEVLTSLAPIISEMLPDILPSLLPALLSAAVTLLSSFMSTLPGLLTTMLPVLANSIITLLNQAFLMLPQLLGTLLPLILETGLTLILSLAQSLTDNVPALIPAITSIIVQLVTMLTAPENLMNLINAALLLMVALADGIVAAIPELMSAAPVVISNLAAGIIASLPLIIGAASELVLALMEGIIAYGRGLVDQGKQLVDLVGGGFREKINDALTWGKDLIQNFIDGLTAKWQALKNTVSGIAQSIKDFLGFSEPEKGPLSNFHTYAPDMIDLYSKGILAGKRQIQNAVSELAGIAAKELKVNHAFSVISNIPQKTPYIASGQLVPPTVSFIESRNSNYSEITNSNTTMAMQSLEAKLDQLGDRISKMQVVLDSGKTVGGLLSETDRQLGSRQILANRGIY